MLSQCGCHGSKFSAAALKAIDGRTMQSVSTSSHTLKRPDFVSGAVDLEGVLECQGGGNVFHMLVMASKDARPEDR